MPAALYFSAKSVAESAGPDIADLLGKFESWLFSSLEVAMPWHSTGAQLVENLREEAHFCGDASYGDPNDFALFLIDCAREFSIATSEYDKCVAYRKVCQRHTRKGSKILVGALPTILIRICGSPAILVMALQRMVGDAAVEQLKRKEISILDAEELVRVNWDPSLFDPSDCLARGDTVFATLYSSALLALDAQSVAECLGLPCATSPSTGRIRSWHITACEYNATAVSNHRFPTIADAETFPGFRPAPDLIPDRSDSSSCFGWTKPIGTGDPQPELVHNNSSLRVARAPIRYLGSFDK
jgi:hypothetical protein